MATPVGKWPSSRRRARGGISTDGTGAGAGKTPAHGPAYGTVPPLMRPGPGGSAGRLGPVDDVEERTDVVRATVLVVQVVGVFPDVQREDRGIA